MSNETPLPIVKLSDADLEGYVPFSSGGGPKRDLLPFKGIVAVKPVAVAPGRAKPGEGQTVGNAKLHFDLEVVEPDFAGLSLVKDQPVEGRQKNDGKPNALGLVDALISSGLPQDVAINLVREGHSLPEIAGLFLRPDAVLYVEVSENIWTPTEGKNAGKTYVNSQVDRWKSKTDYEAALAAKQNRKPISASARAYYEANVGAIPASVTHLYSGQAAAGAPLPPAAAPQSAPAATPQNGPAVQPTAQTSALQAALAAITGRRA